MRFTRAKLAARCRRLDSASSQARHQLPVFTWEGIASHSCPAPHRQRSFMRALV